MFRKSNAIRRKSTFVPSRMSTFTLCEIEIVYLLSSEFDVSIETISKTFVHNEFYHASEVVADLQKTATVHSDRVRVPHEFIQIDKSQFLHTKIKRSAVETSTRRRLSSSPTNPDLDRENAETGDVSTSPSTDNLALKILEIGRNRRAGCTACFRHPTIRNRVADDTAQSRGGTKMGDSDDDLRQAAPTHRAMQFSFR